MLKKIIVISLVLLVVGCGNSKDNLSDIKDEDGSNVIDAELELETKAALYKRIFIDFRYYDKDFFDKYVDSQGVYAWQNVRGDINKFDDEYDNLESNYKSFDGVYKKFHDIDMTNWNNKTRMIEDTSVKTYEALRKLYYKVELNEARDIKVEKLREDIFKVNLEMNINDIKKEFDVIFYKDKVIDIKIKESDDSKTDIFVSLYSNFDFINNKLDGRYIEKSNEYNMMSDIVAELNFSSEGSVTYNVFSIKNRVIAKDNLKGRYEVEDTDKPLKKVTIVMDRKIDEDGEEILLDKEITWSFYKSYSGVRISTCYFMHQVN